MRSLQLRLNQEHKGLGNVIRTLKMKLGLFLARGFSKSRAGLHEVRRKTFRVF